MMHYIGIALLILIMYLYFTTKNYFFYIKIREGEIIKIKGNVPAVLLTNIKSIVKKPKVMKGTIRAVHQGRPRLLFKGDISEGQQQKIRNVFGLLPMSNLKKP